MTFSFGLRLNVCLDLHINGRKVLIKKNLNLNVKATAPNYN